MTVCFSSNRNVMAFEPNQFFYENFDGNSHAYNDLLYEGKDSKSGQNCLRFNLTTANSIKKASFPLQNITSGVYKFEFWLKSDNKCRFTIDITNKGVKEAL